MFSFHLLKCYTLNFFLLTSLFLACSDMEIYENLHNIHTEKGFYDEDVLWNTLDIPVCWENKRDIKQEDRDYVKAAINETWATAVPFNFYGWDQCQFNSPGIRIIAEDDRGYAYLGTIIDGRTNGMRLNIHFKEYRQHCNQSEEYRKLCIRQTAVHEFGHALGISHEQERPDMPQEFKGHQCTDEVKVGDEVGVMVGEWDLHSVMNYCNPTRSGNGMLSKGDIETIRQAYQHLITNPSDSEHTQNPQENNSIIEESQNTWGNTMTETNPTDSFGGSNTVDHQDICMELDLYADGICDEFCETPDPDCQNGQNGGHPGDDWDGSEGEFGGAY